MKINFMSESKIFDVMRYSFEKLITKSLTFIEIKYILKPHSCEVTVTEIISNHDFI